MELYSGSGIPQIGPALESRMSGQKGKSDRSERTCMKRSSILDMFFRLESNETWTYRSRGIFTPEYLRIYQGPCLSELASMQ